MPHLPYNPSATEPCVALLPAPIPTNRKASCCYLTWMKKCESPRSHNRA